MFYLIFKKTKTKLLFLTLLYTLVLIPKAKIAVFDLGGVLFHTKIPVRSLYQQITLKTLLKYLLHPYTTKLNIKGKMLTCLDKIKQRTEEDHFVDLPVDEQGNPLPLLMQEWLSGNITSDQATALIQKTAKENRAIFNCSVERKLMLKIMSFIFNPTMFIETQQIHPDALKVVKKLKEDGFQLYALSNWDSESFLLMQEKHKDLFALFDGIMISGEEGLVKPSPHFYHAFLKKYNLDPKLCIFIDDQRANIIGAQSVGMHGFVCPTSNKYTFFLKQTANLFAVYKKIINYHKVL